MLNTINCLKCRDALLIKSFEFVESIIKKPFKHDNHVKHNQIIHWAYKTKPHRTLRYKHEFP